MTQQLPPTNTSALNLSLLVRELACSLVTHPEDVKVEMIGENGGWTYLLRVHAEDVDNVVGQLGRTVQSVHIIVSGASRKRNDRSVLRVAQ